jgi:uncharacterized protein (TIGR03085 family)
VSLVERERADLADTLAAVGPDRPTLCEGWTTRDLAAHIVVRERRPDAAVGIVLRPLAGHLARVQREVAATPWPDLVARLRTRSPLLPGPLDTLVNETELYVHHEDVRRAQPGWTARPPDPELERMAWRALRQQGRLYYRGAAGGVVLEQPDGTRHTVKEGQPTTVLTGPATELLLHAFGRTTVALVETHQDRPS